MDTPYESLAEPLPPHLAPPELWPEYGTLAMPRTPCVRETIDTNVPGGIRWGLWPIYFEEYLSDEEPDLERAAASGKLLRPRTIAWKRLRRTDTPPGWFTLSKRTWRIDAYRTLPEGEPHTAQWNKNARTNLRTWQSLEQRGLYSIEEVSIDEFMDAYRFSTVRKKVGDRELARVLKRKFSMPGVLPHLSLWGVRNRATGKLVAGTGAVHSPTFKASIREASFITPEARKAYASTALMDRWALEAKRRKMEALYFTHFWQKGDPKNWKGFSAFKSHFGHLHYIKYPPILWRLRGGKIF